MPGGRPPGSLNKRHLTVHELFRNLGYNPILSMYNLSQTTDNEIVKFKCHAECARYYAPALRQLTVDGGITQSHELVYSQGALDFIARRIAQLSPSLLPNVGQEVSNPDQDVIDAEAKPVSDCND